MLWNDVVLSWYYCMGHLHFLPCVSWVQYENVVVHYCSYIELYWTRIHCQYDDGGVSFELYYMLSCKPYLFVFILLLQTVWWHKKSNLCFLVCNILCSLDDKSLQNGILTFPLCGCIMEPQHKRRSWYGLLSRLR